MKRLYQSDIGLRILDAISDGIGVFQFANISYRLAITVDDARTIDIERRRASIQREFNRLKRKKLIEEKIRNGKKAYELTELGKYVNKLAKTPPLHDGKRKTIITFDIPESQRKYRDSFRRHLRSAGFVRLHRSVWYSDRDWTWVFREHAKRMKINDWVHIIVGDLDTVKPD